MKAITVYFDGYCHLCNGFTRFVAKRDRRKIFSFISLQNVSEEENAKIAQLGNIDSIIVEYQNKYYIKSEAFILCMTQLYIWGFFVKILRIFPLSFRDKIYDFISKNRHRWFGRSGI